jgi:hypothetical protein
MRKRRGTEQPGRGRTSKTDTTGEGATAYLSPLTMRLVRSWLQDALMILLAGIFLFFSSQR